MVSKVLWVVSFPRCTAGLKIVGSCCNRTHTPANTNATTPLTSVRSFSLRKQPTFGDVTTGFPAKWRLRNERRNSILMTRHYPDLGSTSDWSCRVGNLIQPIRSTTQIWVVTRHQYGISALVSKTSFDGETSGSVAKWRLFSQANVALVSYEFALSGENNRDEPG